MKKFFLVLMVTSLALFGTAFASSSINWPATGTSTIGTGSPPLTPKRADAQGAMVGNNLYLFWGYKTANANELVMSNKIYKLNTTTQAWSTLTPVMPTATVCPYADDGIGTRDTCPPDSTTTVDSFTHMAVAVNGTDIYLIGGRTGVSSCVSVPPVYCNDTTYASNVVYRFDTTTDTFNNTFPGTSVALPTLPAARGSGQAFILGSKLHFVSGNTDGYHAPESINHWELKITDSTSSWTARAALPSGAARSHFTVQVVGTEAYLFGGQTGTTRWSTGGPTVLNTGYKYAQGDTAWTPISNMDVYRSHVGGQTVVNGTDIIFCGGDGQTHDVANTDCHKYDTVNDAWSSFTGTLPFGKYAGIGGLDSSGKWWLATGSPMGQNGATTEEGCFDVSC